MQHFIDSLSFNIVIIRVDRPDNGSSAPRIHQANRPAANLLGYSEIELVGQALTQIFATDKEIALWHSTISKMGNSTDDNFFEGEIITKDRHKIHAMFSISLLPKQVPENTDIILLIQVIRPDNAHYLAHRADDLSANEDITSRKQVESALIESEERFRQMAEMTGEWLWEQDPNGFYLYSSNAVTQILGFSRNQIIGKHYTQFLTAHDQENQQTYAASQRPFYALVNHYQHKNGHEVLTESTGLPIINAQGKLIKWRGVDRDITARMHFQTALIESEKRTRLIIESSMNAIVIMDSYGIIADWNQRAEKMFGWTSDEAIGQRLDELVIPARFRSMHRKGLQAFLQGGVASILNKQTEQVALRRDGTEFPVELSVSPLKLGNAYIFSGFIHDISSRKAAEEEFRQARVNLAIAQNEIRIAQQIQATLSPSAPIKLNGFEITGFCLPADKVGGDYFDYFFRKEAQLDMVIADVSGHSIGPALFMIEARSAIRAQTNLLATPSETLVVLNSFLFDDLDKSDYFITLFYLQYNIHTQRLRFANAGHPPPLLFSRYEGEFKKLDAEGLILGVKKDVVFEERTTMLGAGDLILFYTDGLTEAENANGEFFGLERVKAIVLQDTDKTAQAIIDALFEALRQFCQRTIFYDDITIMVFKCADNADTVW